MALGVEGEGKVLSHTRRRSRHQNDLGVLGRAGQDTVAVAKGRGRPGEQQDAQDAQCQWRRFVLELAGESRKRRAHDDEEEDDNG